jgi:hypothetical protein
MPLIISSAGSEPSLQFSFTVSIADGELTIRVHALLHMVNHFLPDDAYPLAGSS